MKLGTKLLLAQAPLVLALAVSGTAGSLITHALGRGSQDILKDNYRSVLAAERMKDSLERMDRGVLFAILGADAAGRAQEASAQQRLEQELQTQSGNITEAGEAAATQRLRAAWLQWRQSLASIEVQTDPAAQRALYFDAMLPAFTRVKDAADTILALNQDAMVRKSEHAEQLARQLNRALIVVALLGCLLGIWGASSLTARLLRPLAVLSVASRRIGEGDLEARALALGQDEIAEVASEFNLMAERLKAYRESSLGELIEAQRSSQAAIDSLPDPVLVLTIERRLVHLNRAAEHLLRISLDGSHDPIARLQPALRSILDRLHEHVLRGKGEALPKALDEAVRVATPDGDRHFLPRATPVHSEQGDVIGTTVVLQDVTRQLRVDELRNDLVATVAHEFRTPLTSMRMALHLLTEAAAGPLSDKQADLLFAAREDCERLQSIVEELLDLSRIQAGRLELRLAPLDVDELVRVALDSHRAAAAERHVTLASEVFPGLGHVQADRDRIQLAFGNLLSNAIRYSPEAGTVTLAASRRDGQVRFEVRDQGPGVARAYQQAIFEKYFQMPGEQRGGAGLGLFIARELVHAHGGELGVISQPGHGSTFWLTLPWVELRAS